MIAEHVTNTRLLNACVDYKNLNFLIMSISPLVGHFSAGELNVI